MVMTKKRGKLSLEEMAFIKDNAGKLQVEEIARELNRTAAPIKRFLRENHLIHTGVSQEEEDKIRLKQRLHSTSYWQEVLQQCAPGEVEIFETQWIGFIQQFREDVVSSEELQIKQYIILDILINRSMKERKKHIEDIERIQGILNEEYDLPPEERDADRIDNFERQLTFARSAVGTFTKEHVDLLRQWNEIGKQLKATRDQRFKDIEDSKTTYTGYIKMLEDEQEREREGKNIGLMERAMEEARRKISEYHEYDDGEVDIPFLTPETVEDLEE